MIPSVIVVWWAFVALGLVFILTGLALAFPIQFSIIYMIADPIGIALTSVGGFAFMLAVHRIATYLLVILVIMHPGPAPLVVPAAYRVLRSLCGQPVI